VTGELALYLASGLLCAAVIFFYLRREERRNRVMRTRLAEAQVRGLTEPASLHPRIDPGRCVGSGACVRACPEHHVIGLVDNKAVLINASACVGHGACEASCPVEAIDLVFGTARRGVELPRVRPTYETNVPGLYIAGELGGMGLIRNAVNQGTQAATAIAASLRGQPATDPEQHDLLVVGAGPAGLAAALQAQLDGLRAVVVEQDSPGGTILHYPRRKLVMTQPMCLPGEEPLRRREIGKEELLELLAATLDRRRPTLHCGEQVVQVRAEADGFHLGTRRADGGTAVWRARRVLLAIGRRGTPRRLGVPGEEQGIVQYQLRDPEQFAGLACVVAGGGDSAIEGALRLAAAGAASVDLVHRGGSFVRARVPNQDALREAAAAGRIRVHLDSLPVRVQASGLEIAGGGATTLLPAGLVLVQIGGELPTGLLRQAGVVIDTHFGRQVRRGDAA
jgi:thioredoxin reductase/NAD-dependent dihydropyrimidine dehydrogenase PreA subunit